MNSVTVTYKNEKKKPLADACKHFHPIVMIDDPAFVKDPKKPDEPIPQIPECSDEENIKREIVDHLKSIEARYRQMTEQNKIKYIKDDDLIEKT